MSFVQKLKKCLKFRRPPEAYYNESFIHTCNIEIIIVNKV